MKFLAPWLGLAVACQDPGSPAAHHTTASDGTTPVATTPPDPTDPTVPDPTEPAPDPVWMSISGGGYETHTAQAAWTMSMLEASGLTLDELMANVQGISTSSGSSWFLTQLVWSEPFRDALENDPDGYQTTGYLGQSAALFSVADPCAAWSGPARTVCDDVDVLQPLFAISSLPGVESLDWEAFVEHVVFAPFGMDAELGDSTLASERQSWARGKSILLGTTLLTDDVVLDEQSGFPYDKDLYKAHPDTADVPSPDKFSPAFLASVDSPDLVPPELFGPVPFQLDYTTNAVFDPPSVSVDFPVGEPAAMNLLEAASVSSASGAAAASIQAIDEMGLTDGVPVTDDEMSSLLRDFAPGFHVGADGLERYEPTWGIDDNAAQLALRMGDGGFIDNTGVVFMLSHLADNGLLDDFTLVSFVNTTYPVSQLGAVEVTDNIGFLFGRASVDPVDGVADTCSSGFCLPVHIPQVFESTGLDNAVTTWTYADRGVTLVHDVVDVVTVDNPTLGIEAGHHGTVHFFLSRDEDSDILPLDADVLATYDDVLDVTRDAVLEHGGWDELKSAFHL